MEASTLATRVLGFKNWFLDLLEAGSTGRVLKYDPAKKTTSVVLSNLSFPNGVALSPDEDYLLVAETWKFRCLKHWLKGDLKGTTEVFIDNLPAGPDNINLAPDGSFWVALTQLRSRWLDLIHPLPWAKRVVAAFPRIVELSKTTAGSAMVVNVGADGKIRRILDDSDGKVMAFVTSVLEHEGYLYLGNLHRNFIGKFNLKE